MSKELLNIAKELSEKPTTELALQFMELTADNITKDKEIDKLNNIIKGYNLILRDIGDECYEKKMETGDAGYYDIMEKIDKLIGE